MQFDVDVSALAELRRQLTSLHRRLDDGPLRLLGDEFDGAPVLEDAFRDAQRRWQRQADGADDLLGDLVRRLGAAVTGYVTTERETTDAAGQVQL